MAELSEKSYSLFYPGKTRASARVPFPGLGKKKMVVPDWSFFDYPWKFGILKNGLISQISKLSSEGVHIHQSSKIGDNVEIESPCFIARMLK